MPAGLGRISLPNGNQNLTCRENVRIWVYKNPTTAKILKIAGLILGIGLLAFIPFTIPLGIGVVTGLAVAGITATVASLILFACNSPNLSIEDLWSLLKKETKAQQKKLEFLSKNEVPSRFFDIYCPKKTAVSIDGQYLHANNVGEGIITQRSFVASQAPLKDDYEPFWKVVFRDEPIIIDLTTMKEQSSGEVTKYYPDELNKTMENGFMMVTLIKKSDYTYIYQIKNNRTGVNKEITRFHYVDWGDFSAVPLLALRELVQEVETLSSNSKDLLWIHCRAGVGRTGTLITALVLKEKIGCGEIIKENLDDSLVDIIVNLRKQRGPAFVQKWEQLDLLRQYANFLIVEKTKDC